VTVICSNATGCHDSSAPHWVAPLPVRLSLEKHTLWQPFQASTAAQTAALNLSAPTTQGRIATERAKSGRPAPKQSA
jgi:hypothetical protein